MDTTGSTLGMSIAVGMALFATTMFLGWMSNRYGWNPNILKWLVLPTIGFGITLGLNSGFQSVLCGSVDIAQIAKGSLAVLGAILLFLLLTLVSFIRAPIEGIVSAKFYNQWAGVVALSYYMFWAGMLGETVAGGLAQACPKP
jgi:hypothetical protein